MTGATILKGYVNTPEGQIHYRAGGEGFPLVLLHQNPSSSMMWEAVQPGLIAGGRRVIAFDTPGYGLSDPPPTKPDIPYYARRILDALDRLGVDRFDVCGHHTGALIGGVLAADHPDRVRSFIPVGYPLLDPTFRANLANAKPQVYTVEGTELGPIWQSIRHLGGPWLTPHVARRCLIEKLQAGENWNWAYHAVSAMDDAALARRITVPTLIIAGRGDPLWDESEAAAQVIPNARCVIIDDGGVNLPDDAPHAFVAELDRFLTSLS